MRIRITDNEKAAGHIFRNLIARGKIAETPAAIAYSALSEYESKVKIALEANPDDPA